MKLNLLPQTVSKGRALKTAWFFGAILMVCSLVVAIFMSHSASEALKASTQRVDDTKQAAADAVTTADSANTVVATAADVIRDANLSKAMIDHNDVYPALYNEVLPFVPSFFRLTSISAAAEDASTCKVTLVGTIGSYEQYSDVVLALMRDKNATEILRTGYNYEPTIVPGLSSQDLVGTPRKQGEQPVPTDQLERLAYFQARAQGGTGYLASNNYGATGDAPKGAMPGQSQITIVMTMTKDLQAPDPEATLAAGGSATAAAAPGATASAPGAGLGGPAMPGMPGGPGGPGGPPPGPGGRTGGSRGD